MEYVDLINKKKEMCNYYDRIKDCDKSCPLNSSNNRRNMACGAFILNCPEEAQDIISNWEEPIDWSTIPIDTKILVRDTVDSKWSRAYFAGYKNGKVYAFNHGATSWSVLNEYLSRRSWKYAKLYIEDKDTSNKED